MGRVEKTVFISYRRTNFYTALAVYQDLTAHGYDVFFDYQSIDSGNFEKIIFENIRYRAHFLIILSPSAIERIKEPNAILRREIEMAMDEKRNIVPLMMEGFDFGSSKAKEALTGKLAILSSFNGLKLVSEYFFEGMEKLRKRYLSIALEDVLLPDLSAEIQEDTEEELAKVNEEPTVEEKSRTAEEWFERGFVFQQNKNLEEALRCYDEVIHLGSDEQILAITYSNRGVLFDDFKRYEEAEAAYRKAIELNPAYATAYSNLGNLLSDEKLERYEEAEAAYRKAIELNPGLEYSHLNLGQLYFDTGKYADAIHIFSKAIDFDSNFGRCYRMRGLVYQTKGEIELALHDYRQAVELLPDYGLARMSLFGLLMKTGKVSEAGKHEELARLFAKNDSEYNQACFEALCGNDDDALDLLETAFANGQSSKVWARQDPDLESLRENPRFKQLVSE